MKNLAAAFIKAKRAFGPALKDKTNPAFRSKYADLGACIDAVEEALLANGIAFIQETSKDETGVTVETVFLHESGEERRCGVLHVPAAKQDPQGYGSALTYARRYSLMAACGIAPEDDDGNAASKPTKPAITRLEGPRGVAAAVLATSAPIPDSRKAYIDGLASDLNRESEEGRTTEAILDAINAEKLDDVERIYLSTKMPSGLRNALTTLSRIRNTKPAKETA
jgi:hypothetical protein